MKKYIHGEVSLPAVLTKKIVAILGNASKKNQLNVEEKQKAKIYAHLLQEKVKPAQRQVLLPKKQVWKILQFLLNLLADERAVKILSNLFTGGAK